MKRFTLILALIMIALLSFAQPGPGDPGYIGGGAAVPLDGGLLIALLAGATVAISSFRKKKNKDKQE